MPSVYSMAYIQPTAYPHRAVPHQVVVGLADAAHLGQLTLVDLAGSERLARTEATARSKP